MLLMLPTSIQPMMRPRRYLQSKSFFSNRLAKIQQTIQPKGKSKETIMDFESSNRETLEVSQIITNSNFRIKKKYGYSVGKRQEN